MNYPQSLAKAKTLLQQKHHAQAVQAAASALESLLVELYNELLGQSPPARQKQLVEAQEQVGGGQPLNKLTLGKLVGIYRASRAGEDLVKTLGYKLTYLNVNALEPLVSIRNKAVHEGHQPDPAEAAYIVTQVELILRETGRISPSPSEERGPGGEVPWWQIVTPHRDIREGRLNLKVFAVDLAQVEAGKAAAEYQDPNTFFRRTFLTRGLRSTLAGVLRRLANKDDGVSITQMATVFGGGKTHTLLALYHMVKHGDRLAYLEPVQELLAEAGLDNVPAARVVAIDCASISPSQPREVAGVSGETIPLRTLWGEIAYRLGAPDRSLEFYDLVRESDEMGVSPGSDALQALFAAAGPSLLLIDETLSYITKASGLKLGKGYLSDQAQEFLLELTRAVNADDDVALVLTMTSSEQEQIGEAAMRAASEIETAVRILRRTRQVEISAEREELYEILKRRLFDTEPAQMEAQARGVAQAYWDYYRGHPSDFPQEAQAPEYRELMARSYPFHPALIEILRDRWGSISGFQRTRGVLRLLALVIGDLYRRQVAAPLIQPAHVNLDDGKIRAELLEYVDNKGGYESAILSDIGGTGESKAPLLDRFTGGDYGRYQIATGLATATFMYSHSGAMQRAASAERPQLWLATLRPGIVPALAADALDKLHARLWYLEVHESTYRIDSQPNLNQMLVTRIESVRQDAEAVRERIKQAVEEVTGRRIFPETVVWPAGPESVDNRRRLSLVILDLEQAWWQSEAGRSKTVDFVQGILANANNTPSTGSGQRFRQFKNTLVFMAPTEEGVRVVENTAVQLLALEAIHRQYRAGGLSEMQMEDLNTRLDRARKGLPGAVWGAYTVTLAPAGSADGKTTLWERQEHGFAGYRPGEHTLADRAWQRLSDEQRLLSRLDPRLISEGKGDQWRLWPADEDRINVATLWDYFCRFPYLPMLTGPEALQQTIAWGVQRNLFAYALGDGASFDTVRFEESLPVGEFAIIDGAWLLRPALATKLTRPAAATEPVAPVSAPQGGEERQEIVEEEPPTTLASSQVRPSPPMPPSVYRRVSIDTPVNWRQWYDFYQAVIQPLVEAGMEMRVHLHLEVTGEVDANLIDLSVKESVLQFDATGTVRVE